MPLTTRALGHAPIVFALLFSASCGPAQRGAAQEPPARTVQPGAPGEESRVLPPGASIHFEFPAHTDADVHFMRMMIPHHEQALEMAALVPARTERRDIRMMALRIEASQADEIALMKQWLEIRGETAYEDDPHAGHMPGMLSPEEMARLEAASGAEFDRLFLEYMIMHHEGAVTMVAELFRSPAGGQEGEIYQMASHIDSDQKMEIERMRRMLLGEL